MADVRAVMAVSQAVLGVLQGSYRDDVFNTELEFESYTTRDFTDRTIQTGVSLFLYRVMVNGSHRTPPGRLDALGRPRQTQLPVDLHFFLTAWAANASLQHTLVGWMMRTLEDTPILPASLLNAAVPGSFRAEEVVEINLGELSNEDLLRIWDTLGPYQLSVPYVARVVRIESVERAPGGDPMPVLERSSDVGLVRSGEAPRP